MYLTKDSFVLFNGVRVQIAGVAATATEAGVSPTTGVYNFYQGNDATKWIVNTHLFQAVTLSGAYPGIDARFTTSSLSGLGIGVGEIIFSIAPGADPSPIGVAVLNTGASPMNAPGGAIWYSGGRIPGVFAVNAQATQASGSSATTVTSTLSVNAAGVISVQLTGRNPALETDVAIQFTDYELNRFAAPAGFHASTITYPTSFGQDGALVNSPCGSTCTKSVIADLDASGNPIWVTMFGGSGNDTAELATPVGNGVGVSGETTSSDFAVIAGAPHPGAGSAQDIFLAWFDGKSGQLRDATYGGLQGMAAVSQQIASPAGNLAVSGAQGTPIGAQGFILEWQPQTNQFVYTFNVAGQTPSIAFDASSNLYFASATATAPYSIGVGELGPFGALAAPVVNVPVPPSLQPLEIQLQPTANAVWVVYRARTIGSVANPWIRAASVNLSSGQVLFEGQVAALGTIANIGVTQAGNLKLLIGAPAPTEMTMADAPLVAACLNSDYLLILSPSGQLVYAAYVPGSGFDFVNQNESSGAPPPAVVSCFASSAGRVPSMFLAPGELITITGGGFGPSSVIYTAPGADGMYPLSADGFSVTMGGVSAPIIALARGLIAVQAPFELASQTLSGQPAAIQVSQNGQMFQTIPFLVGVSVLNMFDTGDRGNSLNLPALAALNQDGTVNSAANPAAPGSFVSVFGSGAGTLSPPLVTGGVSPIPPAGLLSTSGLYSGCAGCAGIEYLGSAPELSTSLVQINVQLPGTIPGSGVRPQGIGFSLDQTRLNTFFAEPTGVVFVK